MKPESWQRRARCRFEPKALFFPPEGERPDQREARERRAMKTCAACPVIEQCGEHTLDRPEPYGIWGGMTPDDRRIERRRRRETARAA
ncbi:WhiB family transcriptional regulator [Nocardiopsis suaedae]|uniref:Transcriptional regulator WhiB n=1 Tax=Nocardiopsis suaedae TaxID=3018444 RepID=A0ABT4TIP8_9ACTN|nr:WhiB family transcriptional regulator [Nocardiopsis suaedae]MDA2804466.1 WhiB family transcriptional regulator [Nocardiopsis suaedae]